VFGNFRSSLSEVDSGILFVMEVENERYVEGRKRRADKYIHIY